MLQVGLQWGSGKHAALVAGRECFRLGWLRLGGLGRVVAVQLEVRLVGARVEAGRWGIVDGSIGGLPVKARLVAL